jgi:hypothetical protein
MIVRTVPGILLLLSGAAVVPVSDTADNASLPQPRQVARVGDGYRFTFTNITRNSKVPSASGESAVVLRVLDGVARMDYPGAGMPGLPVGAYMLYDASTLRMTMVLPAEKQFVPMDSAGMGGTIRDAQQMMNMTFANVTASRDSLGAGETLFGFATRKFVVRIAYTMNMAMGDMAISMRTETEAETHLSEAVAALDPGFRMSGQSMAKTMGVQAFYNGDTAMVRAVAAASVPAIGFPLMHVQRSRMIQSTDTTTLEIIWRMTGFGKADVPAAELVIPQGFTATDISAMARARMSQEPPAPAASR